MKTKSWRLTRTLRRRLEFRPSTDADIPYLWAAYKAGALRELGGAFANGATMDPDEFELAFATEVRTKYTSEVGTGAWTLFADTKRGFLPVGIVLAFPSTPDPLHCTFFIIGAMLWMPWASKRNKVESAVNFFSKIRREIPMVEYAAEKDKKFFEMIARHGVLRRVGTMHNVYPNQLTSVWETIART